LFFSPFLQGNIIFPFVYKDLISLTFDFALVLYVDLSLIIEFLVVFFEFLDYDVCHFSLDVFELVLVDFIDFALDAF